jgi:hypothetical protein
MPDDNLRMVNGGHRSLRKGIDARLREIADEATRRLPIFDQAAATGRRRQDLVLSRTGRYRLLREDAKPLCCTMRIEAEVYRFTLRSSFDGTAVVRIGRQGNEITLRFVYRSSCSGTPIAVGCR